MTEKKVINKITKLKKIFRNITNKFVVIFLTRVLSMPKNINKITKNKWWKFQRPVSNALDFIQTYVATIAENHNLRKTEFKVLESGSQHCITKSQMYIHKGHIYIVFF